MPENSFEKWSTHTQTKFCPPMFSNPSPSISTVNTCIFSMKVIRQCYSMSLPLNILKMMTRDQNYFSSWWSLKIDDDDGDDAVYAARDNCTRRKWKSLTSTSPTMMMMVMVMIMMVIRLLSNISGDYAGSGRRSLKCKLLLRGRMKFWKFWTAQTPTRRWQTLHSRKNWQTSTLSNLRRSAWHLSRKQMRRGFREHTEHPGG